MSLSLSISFSLPPIGRWRTSRRSWRRRWTLLGSWTHRAPSWTWIAPTSKTTFPPDPPSTSLTASSACNFPSFLILSPFSLDWSFSTRFGRWWNRLKASQSSSSEACFITWVSTLWFPIPGSRLIAEFCAGLAFFQPWLAWYIADSHRGCWRHCWCKWKT